MDVKQIYNLLNTITEEITGRSDIVSEDLSNIVDVGTTIFNATDVDNYVKSLVNHIGKVIFVNRPYSGGAPSVLMDAWEFGSVLEKITAELPDAEENESWELTDRASYDPNIFYKPTVTAKFFNKRTTFEIPVSFTEKQVKESFNSKEQVNGFISMIYNAVDTSLTIKVDSLIARTVNNMIAETVYDDFGGASLSSKSGIKAVNLLKLYNDIFTDATLTADECLTNSDFLKFAAYRIGAYSGYLSKVSTLFNIGGKDRFTAYDRMHVIMLTDFKKAADVYLQASTFHDEFTRFPASEDVPYWQGSGDSFEFEDISNVKVTTASGNSVDVSGVLCVMFDRESLGVSNVDRRVTTNYNPKAEFYTNWYKNDAGYFNDTNENFVVFFVA